MSTVSNTTPLVVVQAPPSFDQEQGGSPNQHHSIEKLVVVLAVITIVAVIAGVLARVCGGGSGGDRDIEGWVERSCRSCIESGIPSPPPPPAPEDPPKPAAEDAKK